MNQGGQGRGDASLAAFAKELNVEAVTANSKLDRFTKKNSAEENQRDCANKKYNKRA